MPVPTKHWLVAQPLTLEASTALSDYPPILRQILFNRGFGNASMARQYLEARQPEFTDPYRLTGLAESVDRLAAALQLGEVIAVYGDYDVDGVTATTLLVEVLQALGANVRGYIPNRFDEGYGLNNEALTSLAQDGVRVVVTVDCGIRSLPELEHAHQLGLDVIVTDHHSPLTELPHCFAIINPKQPGDEYPEKDLAGVGLAYKLAAALVQHLCEKYPGQYPADAADRCLDLVALGTVADLAPLVGENRALVRAGLRQIRQPHRQGLMALMGVSGIRPNRVTATDIGFALGPRLNAAGRLDSALAAYELLSTSNLFEAGKLAQQLENQNRERQQITREIQVKAEEIAMAGGEIPYLLFAADPSFNPGVVGLAAARLSEHYYRPSVVAYCGETLTRGSCRSIPEFHITEALDACRHLLVRHGGHAMAAGFTVRNELLPEFQACLLQLAQERLDQQVLRPTLYADAEVPLSSLHPELLEYLDRLQPTGYGNSQAVFVSRKIKVSNARAVGKDSTHLKLTITDGWVTFDAIGFRLGHWLTEMPGEIDLMYTFELNEFNGRSSLQLNVRDLKPSGTPD